MFCFPSERGTTLKGNNYSTFHGVCGGVGCVGGGRGRDVQKANRSVCLEFNGLLK